MNVPHYWILVSSRGATASRLGCGDAAPWDMTPVLSWWHGLQAVCHRFGTPGQVRRHIPPRAASHAGVREAGCGEAALYAFRTIFADLCRQAKANGNLVQDAWFAALAIEHGCEWITTDRDFARFEGLRWRAPF